jgi:hypothetical protein
MVEVLSLCDTSFFSIVLFIIYAPFFQPYIYTWQCIHPLFQSYLYTWVVSSPTILASASMACNQRCGVVPDMCGLLTHVYVWVFVEKRPCHHNGKLSRPQLRPHPPFAFARPHTSTFIINFVLQKKQLSRPREDTQLVGVAPVYSTHSTPWIITNVLSGIIAIALITFRQ